MKLSVVLPRITGALLAAVISTTMLATQANQPEDVGYIRPLTTPDPVAQLVRDHGCWRHDQQPPADMAGKFPSHAIVDGRYVGKRLADKAFDQVVGGHDHGLTVAALCH